MAITFVGAGTIVSASSVTGPTGTTLSPHASTLTDDLMIAFHHRNMGSAGSGRGTFDAAPTGWTLLAAEKKAGTGQDMDTAIYYKVATSDSESSQNFTHSDTTGEQWAGVTLTFRGIDTTTPIDVAYVKATHYQELLNKASPNVDAFKQIATATDGAFVIAFEAVSHDDITSDANPTNYTIAARHVGGAQDHRQFQIWYREIATAGNETPGAAAYTSNATVAESQQYTIAIRPASGGSTQTVTDFTYISSTATTPTPTSSGSYPITDTDFISSTVTTPDPVSGGSYSITDTNFISSTVTTPDPLSSGSYPITDTNYISSGAITPTPGVDIWSAVSKDQVLDIGLFGTPVAVDGPFVKAGAATQTITDMTYISAATSLYDPSRILSYSVSDTDFISSTVTTPLIGLAGTFAVSDTDYIASTVTTPLQAVIASDVTLPADYIAPVTALYDPGVSGADTIDAPFISSTASLYDPVSSGSFTVTDTDYIAATTTVDLPVLSGTYTVSVDFPASSTNLYDPVSSGSFTVSDTDYITAATALYLPGVTGGAVVKGQITDIGLFGVPTAVDGPFASKGGSLQQLTVDYLPAATVVTDPTLTGDQNLGLDYITPVTALYGSSLGFIDCWWGGVNWWKGAFFDPQFFSCSTITADYIDPATSMYAATISGGGFAISLETDFITGTTTLYDPSTSGTYTFSADYLASTASFGDPALTINVVLTPDFISDTSVFDPAITGSQQIALDRITTVTAVYAIYFSPPQTLELDYITSTNVYDLSLIREAGASGGYLRGFTPPKGAVTKKQKAARRRALKRTIKRVIKRRIEFRPVDIDEDKLNEIERKIEELLKKKYELDELYHMALVAERLEAGQGVPYNDTLEDVTEDFMPVVEAVIQEKILPPYDRKYDDIIAMLLAA